MGQSSKEARSPDQVELDDMMDARGRAAGLAPTNVNLLEVVKLAQKVGDVVHGQLKSLVMPALLTTYYLAALPQGGEPRIKEIHWFIEEGTLQLGFMLTSMRDKREAQA